MDCTPLFFYIYLSLFTYWNVKIIKYGIIYIIVIGIFVTLIALRTYSLSASLLTKGLLLIYFLAASLRNSLKFDCTLCDNL